MVRAILACNDASNSFVARASPHGGREEASGSLAREQLDPDDGDDRGIQGVQKGP